MLITFYDSYRILSKVYSGGAFIKQAFDNTQIEEIKRNTTTKIVYGVLDRDITLEYVLSKYCKKNPKLSIKILLKIGLYSIIYLNIAAHAVIDGIVELTKKLGKSGVKGFVNAVLREYLRSPVSLDVDGIEGLSIKYSYPTFAVKMLKETYGDMLEEILSSDKEHTFVRFNKGIDGKKYLKEINFSYEETPFENCYLVNGFKMNEDFYMGIYTFQSVGSVAIANLVGSGNNLLDCCSAPGGKAVYLADSFNSVTACDVHEHRVKLINSYVERMGKTNVTTKLIDATVYNEEFNGKFDSILVDAPCSGFGVIKDNPDIKLRRTKQNVLELSKLQVEILNNVCKYLSKGGYLCYSTCSIFKEENDLVIKEFLSKNPEFKVVEITSPLNNLKTECGLQFLPNLSMGAGFYFCKLIKN